MLNEKDAVQFLVNTLAETYGVVATETPSIWARYGNYMQRRWKLTNAETEVAVWAVRSMTNQEIADLRGCSVETVNNHLDAVFAKAHIHSRAELSAMLLHDMAKTPEMVW